MRLWGPASCVVSALLAGCRWGTDLPPSDNDSGGYGWLRIEAPWPNSTLSTSAPTFSGSMFVGDTVDSDVPAVRCMLPLIDVTWTNQTTGIERSGYAIGELHQNCSFFGECGDKFWCTNSWQATPVLAPGENRILIRAADSKGNWGTEVRSVLFDPALTVPVVVINGPTRKETWTTPDRSLTLQGYAVDVVDLRWTNNTGQGAATGSVALANSNFTRWEAQLWLVDGDNTVTLSAKAGNGATASTSLLVTLVTP